MSPGLALNFLAIFLPKLLKAGNIRIHYKAWLFLLFIGGKKWQVEIGSYSIAEAGVKLMKTHLLYSTADMYTHHF